MIWFFPLDPSCQPQRTAQALLQIGSFDIDPWEEMGDQESTASMPLVVLPSDCAHSAGGGESNIISFSDSMYSAHELVTSSSKKLYSNVKFGRISSAHFCSPSKYL